MNAHGSSWLFGARNIRHKQQRDQVSSVRGTFGCVKLVYVGSIGRDLAWPGSRLLLMAPMPRYLGRARPRSKNLVRLIIIDLSNQFAADRQGSIGSGLLPPSGALFIRITGGSAKETETIYVRFCSVVTSAHV